MYKCTTLWNFLTPLRYIYIYNIFLRTGHNLSLSLVSNNCIRLTTSKMSCNQEAKLTSGRMAVCMCHSNFWYGSRSPICSISWRSGGAVAIQFRWLKIVIINHNFEVCSCRWRHAIITLTLRKQSSKQFVSAAILKSVNDNPTDSNWQIARFKT